MTDLIIFPEQDDKIITKDADEYIIAGDFDAGSHIWVYSGGLEAHEIDGEIQLPCEDIYAIVINGEIIPVEFNGIQFEMK